MKRDVAPLLLLAAIAALLADLVLADFVGGRVFPDPAAVAALGIGLGQMVLAAFWLVFGGGNLTLRTGMVLAVAGFWVFPLAGVTGQGAAPWLGVLLAQSATAAAIGCGARAGGVRLLPSGGEGAPSRRDRTTPGLQFSLWDSLSWMTALCCVLAVARWVEFPAAAAGRLVFFSLTLAAAGCAALFGVLIARSPAAVLAALAAPLALGALLAAARIPPQPAWSLVALAGLEGCVAACGAVVLRASGYRCVRVRAARYRSAGCGS